jgi:hypothetical protein
MNIILIPVYNDWKSLNRLLIQINKKVKKNNLTKILIINDNSSQKINIQKKKLSKIEQIKILTLKQNLGSQKSITIGLNYLKKLKKDFYITVMDGDGEDNPSKINEMLSLAKKNIKQIITSHRKKRNENYFIKFGYRIHLIACFFFTGNWMSFGNFSCFHSNNLNKILFNNDIWMAYSAGILKNSKIKKVYATRQKRYFEESKVNFLKLIEHSLRIFGVFYNKVFFSSLVYSLLIFIFFPKFYFLLLCIILMNILVLLVRFKNYKKVDFDYRNYIKNIKTV